VRACRGGRGKVGPEAGAGTQAWLSVTANSCHGALHRVGAVSSGVSRDTPDWMGDPGRSRVHSESVGGWWTERGAREWAGRATVGVRACVGEGSE